MTYSKAVESIKSKHARNIAPEAELVRTLKKLERIEIDPWFTIREKKQLYDVLA